MGLRSNSGKPAHLDYDSRVETRLVFDREAGEFNPPLNKSLRYIKTIPLPWIAQVTKLPYSAVRVGLACWFMDGCNKQQPFTLSRATCQQFNISKWDKRRGIRQLERAGVIEVLRQPGRASLIGMVREHKPAREGNGK